MTAGAAEVLTAGLRWLYEVEQPDGALTHQARVSHIVGERRYSFCPRGTLGRPVVSVEVTPPRYGPDWTLENPLTDQDMAVLLDTVQANGHQVKETRYGAGYAAGACVLTDLAHPSLLAAIDLYQAGCPTHPDEHVFCRCGWDAPGHRLFIPPEWPQ